MSGLSPRAAAAAGVVAGRWRAASRGNRVNVALEFRGLAESLDELVAALAEPGGSPQPGWGGFVPVRTVVTVEQTPMLPAGWDPVGVDVRVDPPAEAEVDGSGGERPQRLSKSARDQLDQAEEVDAATAAERVLAAARGAEWIAESVWGPDGPRAMSGKLLAGLCRRARRMADNADREAAEAAHRVQVTPADGGVEVPARDFLELDEVEQVAWGIGALAAGEAVERFHRDAGDVLDGELEG